MEKAGINFFGAGEKLARGQGDAIRDRAVERLRSGVLNLGRVGHSGGDPLGRLDGSVLMRLELRQLIEDCLRKLALLKIEEPIVSKDETPAGLIVGFVLLGVGLALPVGELIDLPKHHDLTVLALTHRSAELVRLFHGQPEGRDVFCRRKQKQIDAPVRLFRHEVARITLNTTVDDRFSGGVPIHTNSQGYIDIAKTVRYCLVESAAERGQFNLAQGCHADLLARNQKLENVTSRSPRTRSNPVMVSIPFKARRKLASTSSLFVVA